MAKKSSKGKVAAARAKDPLLGDMAKLAASEIEDERVFPKRRGDKPSPEVRRRGDQSPLVPDGASKEVLDKLAGMTPRAAAEWLEQNQGNPLARGLQQLLNALPKGKGPSMSRGQRLFEYVTPPDFMGAVETRFGKVTFDLAASKESAKAAGFFSVEDDGLTCSWARAAGLGGIGWLNMPYGREPKSPGIGKWMQRSYEETQKLDLKVLTLSPTSTGQWFRRWCWGKSDVIFITRRITFVGESTPYPKDCMSCRYSKEPLDKRGYSSYLWDWKTDELIVLPCMEAVVEAVPSATIVVPPQDSFKPEAIVLPVSGPTTVTVSVPAPVGKGKSKKSSGQRGLFTEEG